MSSADAPSSSFPAKGPIAMGAIVILCILAGLIFWALSVQISAAISVQGYVVVPGRHVLQHDQSGTVEAVLVREGAHVTAGAPVIRLQAEMVRQKQKEVRHELVALQAEEARLQASIEGAVDLVFDRDLQRAAGRDPALRTLLRAEHALFEAGQTAHLTAQAQAAQQRRQLQTQIAASTQVRAAVEVQSTLIALDLEDRRKLLQRGLSQTGAVRAFERDLARLQGTLAEIDARQRITAERLQELQIEEALRTAERTEALHLQLTEVTQRARALEATERRLRHEIDARTIRAPVSGVIHDLRVKTAESVIRAAQHLAVILPTDAPHHVRAFVPAQDISQVVLHQEVSLRTATMAGRGPALRSGEVIHISADAIEVPDATTRQYEVTIALVAGSEEEPILKPGSPIDVMLLLEKRTPLAFLVQPFTDYFRRALRES